MITETFMSGTHKTMKKCDQFWLMHEIFCIKLFLHGSTYIETKKSLSY